MREELARIRPGTQPVQGYDRTVPNDKASEKYTDQDETVYGKIASLREIYDGWLVTLESGQVWKQMYNKNYMLEVGQKVKISPVRWGSSYRLSVAELGSFIQVERVK